MSSLIIENNAFSIRKFCLVSTIIDYKFRKCLKCLPKYMNKRTTKKSRDINDWIGDDGRAEVDDGEAWMQEKKLAYEMSWNTGVRKFAFFDFLMYGYRFFCEVGLIQPDDSQTYECENTLSIVLFANDDAYPPVKEYPDGVVCTQDAQEILDDYYEFDNETDLLTALQKNGKLVTFKKNSPFRGQNILSNLIARQNGYLMRDEDMITILDELVPGVVDYEIGHGINLWN